ncbi:MAG: ribonuclease domain-containing protein [Acidimicrobiales bacterium]
MIRRPKSPRRWLLLPLWIVFGAVLVLTGCGSDDSSTTTSSTTTTEASGSPTTTLDQPARSTPPSTTQTEVEIVRYSDLPTVTVGELPPEAIDTLRLIRDGGPFPYDQDGSTFQNREGLLPDYDIGFYQEYTVDTPGLSHRGARRLVTGDDGAIYWTADHYASFEELVVG